MLPSPAGPPGPPGRGDSLNVAGPVTLQLIMGTLLADGSWGWTGLRSGLALALVRQGGEFGARSAFFDLVPEDPVVCRPSWSPGGVLVLDDVHPLRNR